MKINLSLKIIGIVLLSSSLIFLVLLYISIRNYTETLKEAFIERAKATTSSIEATIQRNEDLQNKTKLLSTVQKQIWLDADILNVSFNILENNKLITHVSNQEERVGKTPDASNLDALKKGTVVSKLTQDESNQLLSIISPLHISGKLVGTLQIDFTLENVNKKTTEAVRVLIIDFILMMLGFVLLLFFFLEIIVINPLTKIGKGVEAIVKNDYSHRINIRTEDELGVLAQTFNRMVDEVQKSRQEIEQYNKHLEEMVAQKTTLLHDKIIELQNMNKLMIGRELKMVELKNQLDELQKKS